MWLCKRMSERMLIYLCTHISIQDIAHKGVQPDTFFKVNFLRKIRETDFIISSGILNSQNGYYALLLMAIFYSIYVQLLKSEYITFEDEYVILIMFN